MPKNKYNKNNISRLGSHIVEGVEYPNLPSIADEYGMSLNTVYKRYSRGYRGHMFFNYEKSLIDGACEEI